MLKENFFDLIFTMAFLKQEEDEDDKKILSIVFFASKLSNI